MPSRRLRKAVSRRPGYMNNKDDMIYRIADNIVCPLGEGSLAVYEAMRAGKSSSCLHDGGGTGLEPYFASVFEDGFLRGEEGMTLFESLMARSVRGALEQLKSHGYDGLDPASGRVLFIISTTKGNIALLRREDGFSKDSRLLLGGSADALRKSFGNPNRPVTVSNACISGLSAQIVASRQIESGKYDFVIVTGADLLCPFIISGFQSFKALSQERARSFDASRNGLNLGEAAATIIYASSGAVGNIGEAAMLNGKYVALAGGAIANDANHISAPSRTGEGLFRTLSCLFPVLEGRKTGLVCAHGTATAYNDAMEAAALSRASLEKVPVNSLKGYIGHTLGAAGVIETIMSMYEMCYGEILPVPDFHEIGVPVPLDVAARPRHFDGDAFIKTVSGFGGCNASAVFVADDGIARIKACEAGDAGVKVTASVRMDVSGSDVNDIYRSSGTDYPKFFKMDMLSRLGFVAAAKLLDGKGESWDDTAVILANRHASLDDDVKYLATISPGDYYPSPALFVYTLANIVAGEIAIRYGMHGETTFYIDDAFDSAAMSEEARRLIVSRRASKVVFGWIDWYDGKGCADLSLMEKI